jgi:hypothetical protein
MRTRSVGVGRLEDADQSTVLPAIERVAATKHGDAAAAQANTWAGAQTRLQGFMAEGRRRPAHG